MTDGPTGDAGVPTDGTAPDGLPVLASIVARQSEDLSTYAQFLLGTLVGALPADRIVIERRRSMFGRGKDDAPVLSVRVDLGEFGYGLARTKVGAPVVATVVHTVGGIVLRTETVPLDGWSTALAGALRDVARSNADTAAALSRLTGFTV